MSRALAGPKRPQDRVALPDMKTSSEQALTAPVKERGIGAATKDERRGATRASRRRTSRRTIGTAPW